MLTEIQKVNHDLSVLYNIAKLVTHKEQLKLILYGDFDYDTIIYEKEQDTKQLDKINESRSETEQGYCQEPDGL